MLHLPSLASSYISSIADAVEASSHSLGLRGLVIVSLACFVLHVRHRNSACATRHSNCDGDARAHLLYLSRLAGVLEHLSARELTLHFGIVNRSGLHISRRDSLWHALWRIRYTRILHSVPAPIRRLERRGVSGAEAIDVLHQCLRTLRTPPCWWIAGGVAREHYAEQFSRYQRATTSAAAQNKAQVDDAGGWRTFYFFFGLHWQKWVVDCHRDEHDVWLVIHGTIFNVSGFYDHPGQMSPFMRFAGFDATEAFEAMQHNYMEKSDVGRAMIVQELVLPREGTLHCLRPEWVLQKEAVPTLTRWLGGALLLNIHKKLCYHDFW